MADDDEIVIQLESDQTDETTKAEERPRGPDGKFVKAETEAADPAADLAAQFDELKRESEDRKRENARLLEERNRAIEHAARANTEAQTARSQVVYSELETITTGLSAAQQEADAAEAEYITAYEAGDAQKMAKAQRKMALAEAKKLRLDESRAELETRNTQPPQREQPAERMPARQTQQQPNAVDEFLAKCTPATREWLSKHRDYAEDIVAGGTKSARANAAHATAIEKGIQVDTPAYFDHVETYLGLKQPSPERKTDASTNGQAKPRRATVPAAPVNGGSGSSSAGGTTVSLSRSEALAAEDGTHVWNYDDPSPQKKFRKGDPIGRQEFARRKHLMTKQGHYDRSYTEN